MSIWLKSIVGYLLIVSVTMQLLPNKKYEQYVRLFTGFVMIILVLQPLLRMGDFSDYLENHISQFVQEQEALEADIGKETLEFQKQSGQELEDRGTEIEVLPIEQVEVVIND